MKFVHFTDPDGHKVGINPDQVADVRPAEPGVYDPRGRTVIMLASGYHVVREDPEDVQRRLEGS